MDTTICYIKNPVKNTFLFMHRNKKKVDINKGKYIGIGGHIEEDESPKECIVREVFEETGIVLEMPILLGLVKYKQVSGFEEKMYVFYSETNQHISTSCDEGELYWIDRNQFYDLPHWKGDEYFIEYAFGGKKFKNMEYLYNGDDLLKAEMDGVVLFSI